MEKRVLILGCKNYPAFSSKKVISSGMEVYTTELVKYLKQYFRMTIITADAPASQDERVSVIRVPIFGGHFFQPVSLLFFSFFPALRQRAKIDLINTQTPLSSLTAYVLKKWFGIPYIVTVHMYSNSSEKTGSRLLAALYYRIEKLVYATADQIVCAGYRLRDSILERHDVYEDQIVVIHPGAGPFELDEAMSANAIAARLPNPEGYFRVLFLGRLIKENGLMDLLEAMAQLTDTPVKLLIAGNGNLEGAIRRYIEKAHLQNQVELLGIVSGDDKTALLRSVDLVIRTSYHEVFPVAYLEALAHGVPVVATPVGDTEYMAKETGGIEIVPVGDPESIAAAIERQRQRGGLDPEAVLHCQAYLRRITWASQAERTITLFNRVLSKHGMREEASL